MTSRKPPSQRDPAFAAQRLGRSVQSMIPGTMNGRIANASPMKERGEVTPVFVADIAAGGGGTNIEFKYSWVIVQ